MYIESEGGKEYVIAMQEELLTSGAEVLVPTVAELEMLKKEQEDNRREIFTLQRKAEAYREEKEMLDRSGKSSRRSQGKNISYVLLSFLQ